MDLRHQRRVKGLISVVVLSCLSLLAYQNCSEFPAESKLPSKCGQPGASCNSDFTFTYPSSLLAAEVAPPFPYEVDIDTVAFMSCRGRDKYSNDKKYFTLRMMSRTTSTGLGLNSSFLNWVHDHNYGASEVQQILENNAIFSGAELQASIRRNDVNFMSTPVGNDAYSTNVQYPFGQYPIGQNLGYDLADYQAGEYMSSANGRKLIGDINSTYRDTLDNVKVDITGTNSAFLGFQGTHFTSATENTYKLIYSSMIYKEVSGATAYAYGGYVALSGGNFTSPKRKSDGQDSGHGPQVVTNVIYKKVGEAGAGAQMTCPVEGQYRIAGPGHNCSPSGPTTAAETTAYNTANALLNADGRSNFLIDQQKRCIIPNDTTGVGGTAALVECYKDIGTKPVQWGTANTDYCGGTSQYECPRYFSLCYR